jgi:hypothetical protein
LRGNQVPSQKKDNWYQVRRIAVDKMGYGHTQTEPALAPPGVSGLKLAIDGTLLHAVSKAGSE